MSTHPSTPVKTAVSFYIVRHGEHTNDQLTPEGIRTAKAAGGLLSAAFLFDYFYTSGSPRATQTLRIILCALGFSDTSEVTVTEEPAFGVSWTEQCGIEKVYPWTVVKSKIAHARQRGKPLYVADLYLNGIYPTALAFRQQLLTAMSLIAGQKAQTDQDTRILVGGHGSSTYAFLDPVTADPDPPNCSVAVYKWVPSTSSDGFTLVESKLLYIHS